jgi:hypothetical protein
VEVPTQTTCLNLAMCGNTVVRSVEEALQFVRELTKLVMQLVPSGNSTVGPTVLAGELPAAREAARSLW